MYLYRLGHVPALSYAELVSAGLPIVSNTEKFALSEELIDIQQLGGISYVAEDLGVGDMAELVVDYLSNTEEKKKFVGIQLPAEASQSDAIKILKSAGAKKVTFLTKEPSIGDAKRSDQIFFAMQVGMSKRSLRMVEYFDQDKWAKLEASLPVQDMERGQINLKLARTMLSFVTSRDIIDPFCGLGRNAIAVLDLITSAQLSDIDPIAITATTNNINHAITRLKSNIVPTILVAKAQEITPIDPQKSAIVSEGYLGENSQSRSPEEKAKANIVNVLEIYRECFVRWSDLKIKEVVITFPYYPHLTHLIPSTEEHLTKAARDAGYSVTTPGKNLFIRYARPQSFVGHLVFKLSLN
jgi:hypothetical protein